MMNSKTSYFSFSAVLFKENLRRFWIAPAIAILIGVLGLVLPITLAYENGTYEGMAHYISMTFNNYNPICMVLYMAIPLCSGIYVFQYLQRSADTTSIHSMPFSRNKLFFTNVVSGLVMSTLPIAFMGLVMLIIAKPTYYEWGLENGRVVDEAANVFTYMNVLGWVGDTITIAIFVVACTVLAGIITGSPVMQALLSVAFNFITYAIAFPIVYFADTYLYGVTLDLTFLRYLNPIVYDFSEKGCSMGWKGILIILAVSLIIIAVANFVYHIRRNERTGDAITFEIVISVLGILATICGLILGGIYFRMVGGSEISGYIGYIVGAVITFILARMILTKTIKIFNKKSIIQFALCILVCLLMIIGFKVDLLGISRYVPEASQIENVSITMISDSGYIDGQRYNSFDFNIDIPEGNSDILFRGDTMNLSMEPNTTL